MLRADFLPGSGWEFRKAGTVSIPLSIKVQRFNGSRFNGLTSTTGEGSGFGVQGSALAESDGPTGPRANGSTPAAGEGSGFGFRLAVRRPPQAGVQSLPRKVLIRGVNGPKNPDSRVLHAANDPNAQNAPNLHVLSITVNRAVMEKGGSKQLSYDRFRALGAFRAFGSLGWLN